VAATSSLAWASYFVLRIPSRGYLLLRSLLAGVFLVGAGCMGVVGVLEDRSRLAILCAASTFATSVVLGERWRRVTRNGVGAPEVGFRDLSVTWSLAAAALMLAIYVDR